MDKVEPQHIIFRFNTSYTSYKKEQHQVIIVFTEVEELKIMAYFSTSKNTMVATTLFSLYFSSIKFHEKSWAIFCEYLISQILGIYRDF